VRILAGTTSIRLSGDNHDSWGTCTTSTECKTVITAVLTIMSGMDPHMISGTRVGLIESSMVSPVD
jgi:3-oxoacyl-(acyl-carrier-protein) synthase